MISRIKGVLDQINDQFALVENNGVYYEVLLPSGLAQRLKDNGQIGSAIQFETIYYIEAGDRKANHYPRLVGFTNKVDREFFSIFLQVPGLGVRKALKSLVMPISEIASAIELKDADRLKRLPGVGGRLADKIVAELSGKTAKFALAKDSQPLAARADRPPPFADEAIDVLMQLQYTQNEAREMVQAAMKANPKIKQAEELISVVFKTGLGSRGDN